MSSDDEDFATSAKKRKNTSNGDNIDFNVKKPGEHAKVWFLF